MVDTVLRFQASATVLGCSMVLKALPAKAQDLTSFSCRGNLDDFASSLVGGNISFPHKDICIWQEQSEHMDGQDQPRIVQPIVGALKSSHRPELASNLWQFSWFFPLSYGITRF